MDLCNKPGCPRIKGNLKTPPEPCPVVTEAVDANPKAKFGSAKPSLRHIPPVALFELGAVMSGDPKTGGGAAQYGAFNWRETSVNASTYYDAMLRHLTVWYDGQTNDPKSSLNHLAHVMASAAIVLDAASLGKLIDDRPATPGATAHYISENTKKIT